LLRSQSTPFVRARARLQAFGDQDKDNAVFRDYYMPSSPAIFHLLPAQVVVGECTPSIVMMKREELAHVYPKANRLVNDVATMKSI